MWSSVSILNMVLLAIIWTVAQMSILDAPPNYAKPSQRLLVLYKLLLVRLIFRV